MARSPSLSKGKGEAMLRNPRLAGQMERLKEFCTKQPMHVLVADAAGTAMLDLQRAIGELADIRAAAIREMAEDGWTHREIAKELGISRARVEQIINR